MNTDQRYIIVNINPQRGREYAYRVDDFSEETWVHSLWNATHFETQEEAIEIAQQLEGEFPKGSICVKSASIIFSPGIHVIRAKS